MSWISVKDELPKIGQKVILFSNGVVQEEIFMFDMADKNDLGTECFWSRDDLDECPELQQSDFWQPIPTAPSSQHSEYAKCPECGGKIIVERMFCCDCGYDN